ncbi:Glycine cleavage system transcriptional activator [Paraburkholderia caffeinitolerans]|uniref:Glycine cleavage system transcriptional activator n=1 Tax=Paraburkholderia caffeinitolerans TaxID=1723730 RepID=A0A6J5GSQ0_9BURK|nr:LysR family transcriptional regulator [Paraburkholderia caffeinitolerans]CAB3803012.1 Glycine cleavage system transcriptional activator [Paraburkholderia caffeinitolerans]
MRRLPSLIALRFFEEAAQHLSFNRAAKSLCVTQGAVSRQIRILEESLGEKLFERDHRGIRLTEAGAGLLPCVSAAFDMLEQGTRAFSSANARRRLVIALPPTFATQWFSARLPLLSATLPDVELSVRTSAVADCHCTIRFGRGALPGVCSELIAVERHTLVGAPWLGGEPLETLLRKWPRLHVLHEGERLSLWPDWLASAGLSGGHDDNDSGIEFSTLEQAIHAARKGAGLAIVDRNMITEELANGSLVPLSEVQVSGPYGYWLDIAREHAQLAQVRAFADWLRQQIMIGE